MNHKESSCAEFTESERSRVEELYNNYNYKDLNVLNTLKLIKKYLRRAYEENPATFEFNGQHIALPMQYHDFDALLKKRTIAGIKLTATKKQEIREAYYQHSIHSAWRFLLKPNPWMAPNAAFVNSAVDGSWACITTYNQRFIAICWLAVQDKEIQNSPLNYTPKKRTDLFIEELALLNRAHNRAHNVDKKLGNETYQSHGDRPSCYQGMTRRIFSGVTDYPYVTQDKDTLDENRFKVELHDFAISYYRANEQFIRNRTKLMNHANNVLCWNENEQISLKALKEYEIPPQAQELFGTYLKKRYNDNFFYKKISTELQGDAQCHILNFYQYLSVIKIYDLISYEKQYVNVENYILDLKKPSKIEDGLVAFDKPPFVSLDFQKKTTSSIFFESLKRHKAATIVCGVLIAGGLTALMIGTFGAAAIALTILLALKIAGAALMGVSTLSLFAKKAMDYTHVKHDIKCMA